MIALPPVRHRGWLLRTVFRLRVEECLALAFILPTTYLTLVAYAYAGRENILGARLPGGVVRLVVAAMLLLALAAALRLWPRSRFVRSLREVLPFLTCILIYTNLHDTIGFVNANDIHQVLVAIDQWLFGVQPCIWAERFIDPTLTEIMTFFYGNFIWIAPFVPAVLLMQRRGSQFRESMLGIVVCFYLGYALYVVFPAAPPRLYLAHAFTTNLRGHPNLLFHASEKTLELLPADSRAAFPSLHAAVSLLALIYALRHLRRLVWLLLPLVLGLWISTIYLRHHYVIDLLAGWLLVPLAIRATPRLERFWISRQLAYGVTPAEWSFSRPEPSEAAH
ncbi:MAG: phosphatase PAP2 family protein [Vicinamibacteria bacterium]|nr:phosphatase PAP2 family protein [Vicinamibacteria bacterium]